MLEWREMAATGRGRVPGGRDDGVVSPRHLFIAALPTAHAVGYHLPPLPGLRDWRGSGVNRAGNELLGPSLHYGSAENFRVSTSTSTSTMHEKSAGWGNSRYFTFSNAKSLRWARLVGSSARERGASHLCAT